MKLNENELRALHAEACAAVLSSDRSITPAEDAFWPLYIQALLAARGDAEQPVYAYIYEYETAFGVHQQLQPGTYNGSAPTRTVKVYAAPLPAADDTHAELRRLNAIIHSPESNEFLKGASIEAEYQRQLHGVDETDSRYDWQQWFWVTGYLLGKALAACRSGEGNGEKAKHHLVTSAALLNNWHNVLTGEPAASVHSNSGKSVAETIAASEHSTGAVKS